MGKESITPPNEKADPKLYNQKAARDTWAAGLKYAYSPNANQLITNGGAFVYVDDSPVDMLVAQLQWAIANRGPDAAIQGVMDIARGFPEVWDSSMFCIQVATNVDPRVSFDVVKRVKAIVPHLDCVWIFFGANYNQGDLERFQTLARLIREEFGAAAETPVEENRFNEGDFSNLGEISVPLVEEASPGVILPEPSVEETDTSDWFDFEETPPVEENNLSDWFDFEDTTSVNLEAIPDEDEIRWCLTQLTTLGSLYGARAEEPHFNPNLDLILDGEINIFDLVTLANICY